MAISLPNRKKIDIPLGVQAAPNWNNQALSVGQARPVQQNLVVRGARPTPIQPDFMSSVGSFVQHNFIDPAIATGTKVANTVAMPLTGIGGLQQAGWQAVLGDKKGADNTLKATQSALEDLRSKSYVSKDIASGKANPAEFGKGFTSAALDVAPYVIPAGKLVKGGSLATRVAANAGVNAAAGGGVNTANQLINTGKVDPGQVLTSAATGGVLGALSGIRPGKIKLSAKNPKVGATPTQTVRLKAPPQGLTSDGRAVPQTEAPSYSAPTTTPKGGKLSPSRITLMQNMADILNNGGTTDEALHHHFSATNDWKQANQDLKSVLGSTNITRGNVNAKLNPQYGKQALGVVAEGNHNQAILNSNAIHAGVVDKGNAALQAIKKLSPNDHALMDELRGNHYSKLLSQAENPKAFEKAALATKDYNDYTHAVGSGLLDQGVPYRQNYGAPLNYENTAEQIVNARKAFLKHNPTYGKSRSFNNYKEAEAYGLVRKTKNFAEDVQTDVQKRASDLSALTLEQGLEKAHPGKVKVGEIGVDPEGLYKQLLIPHGGSISLPAEIANKINARAPKEVTSKGVKAYDAVNQNLKYIKLGGGTFHGITEGGNILGQQLISGNLIRHPLQNLKGIAAIFSKSQHERNLAGYAGDGKLYKDGVSTLDRARIFGATLKKSQIVSDINPGEWQSKVPIIHQIHDAIFQRQIPEAKMMIIKQMTKDLDIHNVADVEKGRQIARAVNNFGGINRAVDGLTPQTAQKLSRGILATDFTEGRWRTIIDSVSKGGPQGKVARQILVGKSLMFLLPTMAAATAAGKVDWSKPDSITKEITDQLLDPHFYTPFKTKSGITKIAKTPETFVSELGRLIKPFFDGSADPSSGIKHYVTARSSAAASLISQAATNQDYFGNPVVVQKPDGSIDYGKTATGMAINQAPIPVSQGIKTSQGKQSIAEAAINTLGLRNVADPNSPQMKSLNYQQNTRNKLSADDQTKWDSVYGKNTDQYGNPATVTPALDSQNNAYTLLTNPKLIEAGKAIHDNNVKLGLPADPFFGLSPDQQKTVLNMSIDKFRNPAERTLLKDRNQAWLDPFNKARSEYFNKLPKGSNPPPTKELPEPIAPTTIGDYTKITDPTQKRDYLASHPEITDYFTKHSEFIQKGRAKQNLPQYDQYPVPDAATQKLMDQYSSLPKGEANGKSRIRSAWIKAHPNEWATITGQYSKQAQYGLEMDAQLAAYQGTDFSDSGIKDIKNLAKDLGVDSGSGGSGGSGYYKKNGYSKTGSSRVLNPRQYAISLKAGGSIAKPKVHARVGSKIPKKYVARSRGGPTKVTLKKSLV